VYCLFPFKDLTLKPFNETDFKLRSFINKTTVNQFNSQDCQRKQEKNSLIYQLQAFLREAGWFTWQAQIHLQRKH